MNIEDYFLKINEESQAVFRRSVGLRNDLGKAHHLSSCIYEFSRYISDSLEQKILENVSSQLETATLNASLGMYRQAFSSLRLAFEMGLAASYFSVNKLELYEWIDGRGDIKWSSLIDENDGVLSSRFAKAFFTEFSQDIHVYRDKARITYRELSEFVHGNSDTWDECGIKISYQEKLVASYFEKIGAVVEIIFYVLICRYLKSFPKESIEALDFIPEEMSHIPYIREYVGGPKG